MRVNWRLKAMLPVAAALCGGLLLFLWATLSLEDPERRLVLAVAAGGAVVICTILLVVLAVLVHRPLAELQEKIGRLRAGEVNVAASFAGRDDEIGDLGRNFNDMVRQLRESREEIQRLHQTQMSRAEHLATLGELAAGLAHELRNPLAGIAGVIEIIGRDLPVTSPARDIWKEVQNEMRHIQRILNDLLGYARPKPPDIHPADLRATAEHAVEMARQQARSRPIKIELQQRTALPPVDHDAGQIQQVLLNLLLNALQAIDGSGRIEVQLEAREGTVLLTVSDNGRGIPREQLSKIFRPFFTTKGQGTGLGLSLARRIVEAHEGSIEAASTPGQGTLFTITLPVRKSTAS